jgi:hypothetical protein
MKWAKLKAFLLEHVHCSSCNTKTEEWNVIIFHQLAATVLVKHVAWCSIEVNNAVTSKAVNVTVPAFEKRFALLHSKGYAA